MSSFVGHGTTFEFERSPGRPFNILLNSIIEMMDRMENRLSYCFLAAQKISATIYYNRDFSWKVLRNYTANISRVGLIFSPGCLDVRSM